MTKKRNPQDTTLRNLRAIKAKVAKLEENLRISFTLIRLLALTIDEGATIKHAEKRLKAKSRRRQAR